MVALAYIDLSLKGGKGIMKGSSKIFMHVLYSDYYILTNFNDNYVYMYVGITGENERYCYS